MTYAKNKNIVYTLNKEIVEMPLSGNTALKDNPNHMTQLKIFED